MGSAAEQQNKQHNFSGKKANQTDYLFSQNLVRFCAFSRKN